MSLWLAILIIVIGSTAAIGALYLVRLRAPSGGYFVEIGRASGVLGLLGTAFAVLPVLVAVTALLADERGRHSVVTPPRPRAEARDRARPDRLLTSAKLR